MRQSRLIIAVGIFLLGGCVLQHEPSRTSRFFSDYTGFQQVDFKNETLVYRHPVTRVTDYTKFLIAPVSVYDNPSKKISDANRPLYDDLEQELHMKLVTLISKNYKVVTEPGPGVLKFEYAISDIKPYAWLTKPDGTRYFRTDTVNKGSMFELDCHDSQSGERIFAISTLYDGNEYLAYRDPSLLPNIKTAFDNWAHFLESLLTRAKEDRQQAIVADKNAFRPSTVTYLADPKDPDILIYRHPRLRAIDYKHFYIPIPVLKGRPDLTADQRKELGLQLRDEAINIFDDPSMFVNRPGPDVLTVRTLIEESTSTYKFTLECIDPNQSTLIFGMIKNYPHKELLDVYKEWNESLNDRWQDAKDQNNAPSK